MAKWHAHVVHIAQHMDMVGGPGPKPLGPPPKSGAGPHIAPSDRVRGFVAKFSF